MQCNSEKFQSGQIEFRKLTENCEGINTTLPLDHSCYLLLMSYMLNLLEELVFCSRENAVELGVVLYIKIIKTLISLLYCKNISLG